MAGRRPGFRQVGEAHADDAENAVVNSSLIAPIRLLPRAEVVVRVAVAHWQIGCEGTVKTDCVIAWSG